MAGDRRIFSATEVCTLGRHGRVDDDPVLCAINEEGAHNNNWTLGNISFYSCGNVGSLICDSGTSVTTVSLEFARKCGLLDQIRPGVGLRPLTMPDGRKIMPSGVLDMPVTVQLLIDVEDAGMVHWDRSFFLKDVWVLDLGLESPRDIYVAWGDYKYDVAAPASASPLGQLAHLITSGARVVDARRVMPGGGSAAELVRFAPRHTLASVLMEGSGSGVASAGAGAGTGTGAGTGPGFGATTASATPELPVRERLEARVDAAYAGSAEAKQLVDALASVPLAYGTLDVTLCTEIIDFTLVAKPKEVSFKVSANRRVGLNEYK